MISLDFVGEKCLLDECWFVFLFHLTMDIATADPPNESDG